jgi:hypothetical protein
VDSERDIERRERWHARDPKMKSVVRLDSKCLGLRFVLSDGERVTMPLGQTTFKMQLDRSFSQPPRLDH